MEDARSRSPSSLWQRLGINQGRYRGEGIQIDRVLTDIRSSALKRGWRLETFLESAPSSLFACHKPVIAPVKRLYISTGIHGDEPAGPLALLNLIQEAAWPPDTDVTAVPCLNPTGFPLNQRENAAGLDLNRDYRHLTTPEIRAHVRWLEKQPLFDLTLILHEDWEASGFYVYELNPNGLPSLAESIIQRVAVVCPIESAIQVDGWPAAHGIIRPTIRPETRPQWPEALYLISHKTPLSYTLETPSDFPLAARVAALTAAVQAALDTF